MITTMNIGVLGSGPAGRALAKGFLDHGHSVMVGSRTPAKLAAWRAAAGLDVALGTFDETAEFADLVVLSVLGTAAENVIRSIEGEHLAGTIVLDASDPLDFSSGRPGLFVGTTDSLGERLQRLMPQAYVVKGLNTVLADVMVDPTLTGGDPDMFIAGDDEAAKRTVTTLLSDFGWPVVDLGGIQSSRWLEAISLAWVVHSHRTGKTHHAFKLVGK